ncbi:MAG: hypothetical protein AUI85_02600 [Acidobacteriales bacterium 13_1_40CM_3_55_5]|nr:MAG: hypothetical protein AUI85_02600 [Acidobacteriales bacterium 13_1_40CM_3_55_5]
MEPLILALGGPSAIWVVSKVISLSFRAVVHGSPEQRFLAWLSGGVIVEWLFVIGLWFALQSRGLSFRDLMASVGRRAPVGSGFCPEYTFRSHTRSCRMEFTSLLRWLWASQLDSAKKSSFAPF